MAGTHVAFVHYVPANFCIYIILIYFVFGLWDLYFSGLPRHGCAVPRNDKEIKSRTLKYHRHCEGRSHDVAIQ